MVVGYDNLRIYFPVWFIFSVYRYWACAFEKNSFAENWQQLDRMDLGAVIAWLHRYRQHDLVGFGLWIDSLFKYGIARMWFWHSRGFSLTKFHRQ